MVLVIMCTPTHYGEVIHTDVKTRDISMVLGGGRGPEVFLEPFPINLVSFPYVLLITIQLVTPLDYPGFLCDVMPILRGHNKVLNGIAFFKIDLDPHLATNIPETFT